MSLNENSNKHKDDFDLYQHIFNEAADAIFIGDKTGKFIKANFAAESLTGYSNEELLTMKMSDLFSRKEIEQHPLNYSDVLSGKTITIKRYVQKKNGSTVFVEMKSKMLSNGSLISFFSDATPELELKKSEQKYLEVIENIKECLVLLQDEKLKFANENTAKLLGYSLDEIIDKPFLNFVHPDDREKVLANHLARLNEEGNLPSSYNFKLYSKTGQAIWAETNPFLIEYEGKPAVQAFLIDITEKKETELALMQSESKFKSLVENMEEGIASLDQYLKFVYVSPGLTKILGYSKKELLGTEFINLVFQDDVSKIKSGFVDVLKNDLKPSEYRVITKNNDVIWVRSSSKPIFVNGEFTGIDSVIININSLKQIEENLRKSESKYRNMIDISPIGILIHQYGNIIYSNKAFTQLLGYEDDFDFVNTSIYQFCPKQTVVKIKDRVEVIMKTKSKSSLSETILISKDGKFVEVLAFGQYILYEGVPSVQAYFYDMTEFNQYKSDVDKLSHAISQSSSIILTSDFNGVVEFANPAFEKVSGITLKEIVGTGKNLFSALQIGKENFVKIWRAITKGNEWVGELPVKSKTGNDIILHVVVSPIVDKWGKITHFVTIGEDITAKKEIEKNLKLAKEIAEKSDELKSNFLAQMSHEIRTPINAIVSFAGLLKNDLFSTLDDDQRVSFEMIEKSGGRIIRTIELLLNYSELKAKSYKPTFHRIDVNFEILSKFALEYRKLAKIKNIKFNVKIETDNTFFYGDRHSLEQIFSNLIDNAIKYTSEGSVEVKLSKNEHAKFVVEIKDTGKGISENYINDIFNPFSQEEAGYTRSFEGNGLGLALVKEYCEMNNISIKVESTKNAGTTFSLTF